MAYFEYDRLNVRYAIRRSETNRCPLMIFNGIGQSIEVMQPIIDALVDRTIIIFDAPGTGHSDTPLIPWRMKKHAKVAQFLLNKLAIDTVDLLGFSWGGTLAKHFCRYYPQRVRKLILAAAPPGNMMIPGKPDIYLHLMNPMRFYIKGYMKLIAAKIYGGDVRKSLKVVRQNSKRLTAPSMRGYMYQWFAMSGTTPLLWLNKLKQPTMILQGIDDPMVPNINAVIVNKLVQNSKLHFIDCGHMFMLTRTEKIVPMIESFLDDVLLTQDDTLLTQDSVI